jgi:hypothetical protein
MSFQDYFYICNLPKVTLEMIQVRGSSIHVSSREVQALKGFELAFRCRLVVECMSGGENVEALHLVRFWGSLRIGALLTLACAFFPT